MQEAGFKPVEWNVADVASGLYFYPLKAENFVEAAKLIQLK